MERRKHKGKYISIWLGLIVLAILLGEFFLKDFNLIETE